MLKRSIAAVRQWLSSKQINHIENNEVNTARRGLFKKAALGLGSVSATAGLSKVVIDSVAKPDLQKHYIQDSIAGEQELMDREYIPMSSQEKTAMLQTFIDDYKKQS